MHKRLYIYTRIVFIWGNGHFRKKMYQAKNKISYICVCCNIYAVRESVGSEFREIYRGSLSDVFFRKGKHQRILRNF